MTKTKVTYIYSSLRDYTTIEHLLHCYDIYGNNIITIFKNIPTSYCAQIDLNE